MIEYPLSRISLYYWKWQGLCYYFRYEGNPPARIYCITFNFIIGE
jgi:hypothetical protein